MAFYALKNKLGYVESIHAANGLEIAINLRKEIITEKKVLLEGLAKAWNDVAVSKIDVVEIDLKEVAE